MEDKSIYYFAKNELYPDDYDIEKIGIRGKRAIELAKLLMPIVPSVVINSDIADKLNEIKIVDKLKDFFKKFEDEVDKKFDNIDNPSMLKIVMSPSLEISETINIHAIGLTDNTINGFIKNVGEEFAYHEYAKILLNNTINILIKASKDDKESSKYNNLIKDINSSNNIGSYKEIILSAKKILPKEFFLDGYFQLDFLLKFC